MKSKQDFIDRLRESSRFKQAMAAARTPEERAQVSLLAERFVTSFADVLAPLIERAESEPEFAEQLRRSLIEQHSVLTNTDPIASGSTD